MTAIVDICNRALAEVGTRSTITSLTEGSNESNNCSLFYDVVRRQLLRAARWNFASANVTLSLLIAAPGTPENPNLPSNPVWMQGLMPPEPWTYEYAYPSDCLRVQRVRPQLLSVFPGTQLFGVPLASPAIQPRDWSAFKVATDFDKNGNSQTVILTNVEGAIAVYTRDIQNADLFDPAFEEALVAALAGKLVLALTGDKQLAQQKFQLANAAIMEARIADGDEGLTIDNNTPDWIRTRGYAADWLFDGPYADAPYGGPFFSAF